MEKTALTLPQFIRPIDTFIQTEPHEHLYTVLQHVDSCHDPVFVFEQLQSNKLLGMISAYQVLYRQSYPYTTKVLNCYVNAPDIREDSSIYHVLQIMRDTAFNALPVFDKEKKLLGAVRAKELLKELVADNTTLTYVANNVVPQPPVVVEEQASVREVMDILKNVDESRVLVIDKEGQIIGIVTRKDLAKAFIEPTPKQRFSHRGHSGQMAFDGENIYRIDDPIRKYMNYTVYAERLDTDIKTVIGNLLDSQFNSVVLVDIMDKPVAFITIRDVIDTLVKVPEQVEIPIVFQKPSESVRESELAEAEDIIYRFLEKFTKRQSVIKVEVTFKEPKYATGQTAEFNTVIVVETSSGKNFIAHSKREEFLQSIHAAIDEILKQEERMPRKRKNEETKQQLLNILAS